MRSRLILGYLLKLVMSKEEKHQQILLAANLQLDHWYLTAQMRGTGTWPPKDLGVHNEESKCGIPTAHLRGPPKLLDGTIYSQSPLPIRIRAALH
jgi:hypothetical protein